LTCEVAFQLTKYNVAPNCPSAPLPLCVSRLQCRMNALTPIPLEFPWS
jgi:hypothetical protein